MIFTRVFLPTNVFVQMAKNVLLESIPRFWGKDFKKCRFTQKKFWTIYPRNNLAAYPKIFLDNLNDFAKQLQFRKVFLGEKSKCGKLCFPLFSSIFKSSF